MTTSKQRSRTQLAPRAKKRPEKKTETAPENAVSAMFHNPSSRDYVQKMTVEVDRDVYKELKLISVEKGLTIRQIINSCIDQYIKDNR
jgi:hypothetical protein